MENKKTTSDFLKFCFQLENLARFLKGNLLCYISGTEGRRKLKFGEVGLRSVKFFWQKIEEKISRRECPFKFGENAFQAFPNILVNS